MKMFKKKPSNEELYIFFIQLSAFYKAGTLIAAFDKMQAKMRNKIIRKAVVNMKQAIESEGAALSDTMESQRLFPAFVIQAIRAGETSGTLDAVFEEIALNLKQEDEVQRRVNSAILPIKFVAGLLLIAIGVIFIYVVPRFQAIFTDMGIELPIISKIVFTIMTFLINHWIIVAMVIIGAVFFLKWFKKAYPEKIDKLVFVVPVYNDVYYYRLQYRISAMFNLLRNAGIGITVALTHLADVSDNSIVKKALKNAAKNIETEGYSLGEAFDKNNKQGVFDYVLLSYIHTGEESGTTTELLQKAKKYYQDILYTKLQDFGTKITPVFVIPATVIIVLVMISIYMPMFTITQGIHLHK